MTVIRRVHYTSDPDWTFDPLRIYPHHIERLKPTGLWYSAPTVDEHGYARNDGWEHWCTAENYAIKKLAYSHGLAVDLDRMLVLRTVEAVDAFNEEFRADDNRISRIHWGAVGVKYAGIEIAPYHYGIRLDPRYIWYYGWDCASGCVWDLSAVEVL